MPKKQQRKWKRHGAKLLRLRLPELPLDEAIKRLKDDKVFAKASKGFRYDEKD